MAGFGRSRLTLPLVLIALPALIGATAKRDLEGIKKRIENEKKDLSRLEDREVSVIDSLGKIQGELETRKREIKLASAKLSMITGELNNRRGDAIRLAESTARLREALQRRAAALYRWKRAGNPLLIFNSDVSLVGVMRRQHYLQAALSFDRELLAKLEEESRQHAVLREELAQKQEELAEQKQTLATAKEAIGREAKKKQLLLTRLRREKAARLSALKEMEAAAQRLQKMMEEIARRALVKPRNMPTAPAPDGGLEALRGRLEWPVRGQVTAPFGIFKHPEFTAEVIRKGIDIAAPVGEEIKAVEKGRVVYADRFSGYGNMVILDHGKRYYTIYGHVSEIIKKTGESVNRGEALGRAGDSDSFAGSKLYFEIRKDGHSLDPVAWLKKR